MHVPTGFEKDFEYNGLGKGRARLRSGYSTPASRDPAHVSDPKEPVRPVLEAQTGRPRFVKKGGLHRLRSATISTTS